MFPRRVTLRDGRRVLLRKADPEDTVALMAFQQRCLRELPHLGTTAEEAAVEPEELARFLFACRRDPDHLMLLALDEGDAIVGTLGFHVAPGRFYRHKGEVGMMVDRAFWGVGVGRAMMEATLEELRRIGRVHKVNLRVRATNERALRLYRSLGFEVEGRERDAARLGDRYEDEVLMGLVL